MEPTNVGSFGTAIGGSQALVEAAKRRGIDLSAIQQTSPASIGGAPPVPLPASELSTAQTAVGQEVPVQPTQPEAPDSDARIALKALAKVVTDESSLKKDLAKSRIQGII